MTLTLSIDETDTLVVRLREGDVETALGARPASAAMRSLTRALVDAGEGGAEGYGDCYWPGSNGGQYWWIFKRNAETVEVVALWTRGGVSIYEHVFRATDAYAWVRERLDDEIQRVGGV